jgi:Family of unknown function (DUF695)
MVGKSNVEVWATAISTNASNGRQIIFRYAKDLSPAFNRASQPDRIIIVWKYQSASGQPVTEEHRRMNLLEDSLEPLLLEDNFATLALVSTGENLREWTYYAESGDAFIERLNIALAETSSVFPIEIHTARDPTWIMYSQFKAEVQ